MNKVQVEGQWDFAKLIFVNARKQIEKIPENKLDFRPVPEVRSAAELVVHMHQYLTEATETVLKGKHEPSDDPSFSDKAVLLQWVDQQVAQGYQNLEKITEGQLNKTIETWGQKFPGWQILSMVPTEVLHHRGQLMVYLRLMGIEPAFAYDFDATGSAQE